MTNKVPAAEKQIFLLSFFYICFSWRIPEKEVTWLDVLHDF